MESTSNGLPPMSVQEMQSTLDRHDGSRPFRKPPPPPKEPRVKVEPPPPVEKPAFRGLIKKGTLRKPKLHSEKRVYKLVMSIIALKAQGLKHKEIADILNISEGNIKSYLFRANARGQLNMDSFADPEDQMDVVIRSKMARNVNEFMDARDKTVTLKAMEIFNPIAKAEPVIQTNQMVLQVKVELPPAMQSTSTVQIREGTIGGALARGIPIDAEVIESE